MDSQKVSDAPPVPQTFFDEQRSRFGAESYAIDVKSLKENRCPHKFVNRISFSEVKCDGCGMGWVDNNSFIIKDGVITGIKDNS